MSIDLSQLNILHVEDDGWICKVVREYLAAFGIVNIHAVRDGFAAYDALRDFAADIVITDWIMAPMDGFEFTQMVRSAPNSPNPFVPIIMLTSLNTTEQVTRARDAGVTEYLVKPITALNLRRKIISIVENPRAFVKCPHYIGPDRRRMAHPVDGTDRRRAA
jgi:CheY-like chemotaxis protein